MQLDVRLDHQTKAMVMAMGGAVIASVAAMLLPVGLWETLTGSTGISEMIPATAAPLGDTARALIAFGVGALTFAVLALMLLRRNDAVRVAPARAQEPAHYQIDDEPEGDEIPAPSLLTRLKERASGFMEARRGTAQIAGLEDLPKLRSGDAHPDAPPRRPLLATRDLADPDPEVVAQPAEDSIVEAGEPADEVTTDTETVVSEDIPAEISLASLAEMVDRLETALAERGQKLSQLESLIGEESAVKLPQLREVVSEPASADKPAFGLEAIAPSAPTEAEGMDAALRSALETLHRMNARTR
jgi:hypothetical protein